MINFRIIARVFGLLLIVEGLFMLISAGVCLIYHEHAASAFSYSAFITIVTILNLVEYHFSVLIFFLSFSILLIPFMNGKGFYRLTFFGKR